MAELLEIQATGTINGERAARCDILASSEELENLTCIDGYVLMNGSFAWDVVNKSIYALQNGTWYKQTNN